MGKKFKKTITVLLIFCFYFYFTQNTSAQGVMDLLFPDETPFATASPQNTIAPQQSPRATATATARISPIPSPTPVSTPNVTITPSPSPTPIEQQQQQEPEDLLPIGGIQDTPMPSPIPPVINLNELITEILRPDETVTQNSVAEKLVEPITRPFIGEFYENSQLDRNVSQIIVILAILSIISGLKFLKQEIPRISLPTLIPNKSAQY